MSQIASTTAAGFANQSGTDPLRGLDLNDFLRLFIAELQNQDPLNPMDNAQMLQQISQIREIGATDKLTSTLDNMLSNQKKEVEALNALTVAIGSVLLGQNLSSATGLIGKTIKAEDSQGLEIVGVVEKVSIIDGMPKLHIGNDMVSLYSVKEVLSSAA